jgi:hypothetical protein
MGWLKQLFGGGSQPQALVGASSSSRAEIERLLKRLCADEGGPPPCPLDAQYGQYADNKACVQWSM